MHMGCVSYTMRFFPNGKLRRENFKAAAGSIALLWGEQIVTAYLGLMKF